MLCIDLEGGAARSVTPVHVPRPVQLLRVPATPAPLDEVLAALEALELDHLPPQAHPYLEVRVLLDGPEPGLRARVEAALEGKPVRSPSTSWRACSRTTSSAACGSSASAPRPRPT